MIAAITVSCVLALGFPVLCAVTAAYYGCRWLRKGRRL